MRITGGVDRGRRLRAPRSRNVRPTADKVRGAIFDILEARDDLSGKRVLDLFAGSGALGMDALSRGAAHVTFIDGSGESCRVIRGNLERGGLLERSRVRRLPLPRGLGRIPESPLYDVVFVDPPYRRGLCHETLERLGDGSLLSKGAWVIAEHAREDALLESYDSLVREDLRRYGSTAVSLYRKVLPA